LEVSHGFELVKSVCSPISDLQFTPFADIIMRHRIFWWKKPCVNCRNQ